MKKIITTMIDVIFTKSFRTSFRFWKFL